MRMHTAMHLLCSLIKGAAVTGGSVGAERSRLDFDLPNPPPKEEVEAGLNALIAADHPVRLEWVDEAVLDSNPALVRTMSVQPPRGTGRLRLVRIGAGSGAGRPAALRRHACGAHRRDRPHRGGEDREQGQAEPPHHHRAGRDRVRHSASIASTQRLRLPDVHHGRPATGLALCMAAPAGKCPRAGPRAAPSLLPLINSEGPPGSLPPCVCSRRKRDGTACNDRLAGRGARQAGPGGVRCHQIPAERSQGRQSRIPRAHIPGRAVISTSTRSPIPTPTCRTWCPRPGRFARLMGALGVGNDIARGVLRPEGPGLGGARLVADGAVRP